MIIGVQIFGARVLDIYVKSVDIDTDVKFHIRGKSVILAITQP